MAIKSNYGRTSFAMVIMNYGVCGNTLKQYLVNNSFKNTLLGDFLNCYHCVWHKQQPWKTSLGNNLRLSSSPFAVMTVASRISSTLSKVVEAPIVI